MINGCKGSGVVKKCSNVLRAEELGLQSRRHVKEADSLRDDEPNTSLELHN